MVFDSQNNYIFRGILVVQIMLMIDAAFRVFHLDTSQILSLIRYFMYFFGVYWMAKGIKKNHLKQPLLYKTFLLWVAFILISSLPELNNPMQNYVILKSFISGKLFIYSLPFLICSDLDTSFFRSLFRLSYHMMYIYIILAMPLYITEMGLIPTGVSESITFLLEGCLIFLFTLPYQKRNKIMIVVFALLLATVIMMLLARRNKVVYYGGGLSFVILLNVIKGNLSKTRKTIIILLTLVSILFIFNTSLFDAFFNKMEGGMSSREQVIEDFFIDFNKTPSDWIWGRGLFGEFDAGVLNDNDNTGLRDAIENGYLMLILKGGGIWLVLLILISLNSVYKGLFKSNNIFVKGCACIILLYFLDMIGFGVPQASLKYVMVFLSIAVCSSAKWRSYTDDYLKQQLAI